MRITAALFSAGLMCMATVEARAQTIIMNNGGAATVTRNVEDRGKTTITISYQLTVPVVSLSTTPEMTDALTGVMKTLYSIIENECAGLSKSLNGTCKVIRVTSGGNVGRNGLPASLASGNASATFEIEPAPTSGRP